jgi:hypothetical protein
MAATSLEEIRGKISAGEYPVDSSEIAADILSKAALVRKVRRQLMREDVVRVPGEVGRATQPRRPARSEPSDRSKSRRERLS